MSSVDTSSSRESRLYHLYLQYALNRIHEYTSTLLKLTSSDSEELIRLLGVSTLSKGASVASMLSIENNNVPQQNFQKYVKKSIPHMRTVVEGAKYENHSLFHDIYINPQSSNDFYGGHRAAAFRMLLQTLPPLYSVFLYLKFIDTRKIPLPQQAYIYSMQSVVGTNNNNNNNNNSTVSASINASTLHPSKNNANHDILASWEYMVGKNNINTSLSPESTVYASASNAVTPHYVAYLVEAVKSQDINVQDCYRRICSSPTLQPLDIIDRISKQGTLKYTNPYKHAPTSNTHVPFSLLPTSIPAIVHGVILSDLVYIQYALRFLPSMVDHTDTVLASFTHSQKGRDVLHFPNMLNMLASLPQSTVDSIHFSASAAPQVHLRLLLASITALRTIEQSVQTTTKQFTAAEYLTEVTRHTNTILQRQTVYTSLQALRVVRKSNLQICTSGQPDLVYTSKKEEVVFLQRVYNLQKAQSNSQKSTLHRSFLSKLLGIFQCSPVGVLAHKVAQRRELLKQSEEHHSGLGCTSGAYYYYTPTIHLQALQCLRFSGSLGGMAAVKSLLNLLQQLSIKDHTNSYMNSNNPTLMHASYQGIMYPYAGIGQVSRLKQPTSYTIVQSDTIDPTDQEILMASKLTFELIRSGALEHDQSVYSVPIRTLLEQHFRSSTNQLTPTPIHTVDERDQFDKPHGVTYFQPNTTFHRYKNLQPTQHSLRILDLCNSTIPLHSLQSVLLAAQNIPSLQVVLLNRTPMPLGIGPHLASQLVNTNIKVQGVEGSLHSANLLDIAKVLPICHLEQLSLSKNVFEAAEHLLEQQKGIQQNNSLRKLALSACKQGTPALVQLFKALETHKYITHLDISINELTAPSIVALSHLLARSVSLTSLNLLSTGLTAELLQMLVSGIPSTTKLRRQNISWNRFGSAGAPAIKTQLEKIPLTHLSMFHTKLEDAGIALLCDALPPSSLCALDISHNHLSMKAVSILSRVQFQTPKLVELDQTHNKDIVPIIAKGAVFCTPSGPFAGMLGNITGYGLKISLQNDSSIQKVQDTIFQLIQDMHMHVHPLHRLLHTSMQSNIYETKKTTSVTLSVKDIIFDDNSMLSISTSRAILNILMTTQDVEKVLQHSICFELSMNMKTSLKYAMQNILDMKTHASTHVQHYKAVYPAVYSVYDWFLILYLRICIYIRVRVVNDDVSSNNLHNMSTMHNNNMIISELAQQLHTSLAPIVVNGHVTIPWDDIHVARALQNILSRSLPSTPVHTPFCRGIYGNGPQTDQAVDIFTLAGHVANDPYLHQQCEHTYKDKCPRGMFNRQEVLASIVPSVPFGIASAKRYTYKRMPNNQLVNMKQKHTFYRMFMDRHIALRMALVPKDAQQQLASTRIKGKMEHCIPPVTLTPQELHDQICQLLVIVQKEHDYFRAVSTCYRDMSNLVRKSLSQHVLQISGQIDTVLQLKYLPQYVVRVMRILTPSITFQEKQLQGHKYALRVLRSALRERLQLSIVDKEAYQIAAYNEHMQEYNNNVLDMKQWSSLTNAPGLIVAGVEQTMIGVSMKDVTEKPINIQNLRNQSLSQEEHQVLCLLNSEQKQSHEAVLRQFWAAPLSEDAVLDVYCDFHVEAMKQPRAWSWKEELDYGLLQYPGVSVSWLYQQLDRHFSATLLEHNLYGHSLRDFLIPPKLYRPVHYSTPLPSHILLPANHIQLCLARNAQYDTVSRLTLLLHAIREPATRLHQAIKDSPITQNNTDMAAHILAGVSKFLSPSFREIPITSTLQ